MLIYEGGSVKLVATRTETIVLDLFIDHGHYALMDPVTLVYWSCGVYEYKYCNEDIKKSITKRMRNSRWGIV